MQVRAKSNFEHHGARKRDTVFSVSPHTGALLAKKGLVEIVDEKEDQTVPLSKTAGADQQSSASPADQVSLEQTSEQSRDGDLPIRRPWGGKKAKSRRGRS